MPKLQVEEWIELNCWIPIVYKELSICEKGASLAPLFTPLSTRGYNTYGGVIQTIDDKERFCRFPFAYQKYQPWKLTLPFDPRSNKTVSAIYVLSDEMNNLRDYNERNGYRNQPNILRCSAMRLPAFNLTIKSLT